MSRSDGSLIETIDEAVKELVRTRRSNGSVFVTTPLLYPGGSTVMVEVSPSTRGHYTVTDYALGFDEADSMNGGAIYIRHAKDAAESMGVSFDNRVFAAKDVGIDQVAGAIIAVANASQEAVINMASRVEERAREDETEKLYRRLVSIFTVSKVAKRAEIIGASTTTWHVSALVDTGHTRRAAFDAVSAHHLSIFAASTKFHDIALAENAPIRVAVVEKKEDLKTYLAVLSQAANVIERTAPPEAIRRVAHAA